MEAKVKKVVPSLKPKHYRTIQNLTSEWYKALYHTVFHMTKSDYLKYLYDTAVGRQTARERDPNELNLFIKALDVLKKSVDDPTTVGLTNPLTARPQTAQQKGKGKSSAESYAMAVTGKSSSTPPPIGAKVPSKAAEKAKPAAQPSKVAIGATITGSAKAKSKATQPVAKQPGPSAQSDDNLTADSALEFMMQAPATQSFMEFQAEKDRQAALEAQTAEDVQTAQTVQAELDAQAAGDTLATQGVQGTGELDLDEQDEANMQQALLLSRQEAQAHAQAQDADPTASSSAAPGRAIEEEIDSELQLGRDFQREAASLEQKMTTARLTTDELGRLRQLNQLQAVNRDRVVELCERQAQQHQAQQAQDINRMLGSLKPLQSSKQTTSAHKAAPKPAVSKEKSQQPVIVKEYSGAGRVKAPPPRGHLYHYQPRTHQCNNRLEDPPISDQGPSPDTIPGPRFTSGTTATAYVSKETGIVKVPTSTGKSEGTTTTKNSSSSHSYQTSNAS